MHSPVPATQKEIEEQVDLLCRELSRKEGLLLRYLIDPERKAAFVSQTSKEILVAFEEMILNRKLTTKKDIKAGYDRARGIASKLSKFLKSYYRESFEGLDRIKILLPDDMHDQDHRYEPQISRFAPTPHNEKFWFVGDNVAALDYVTERIPELNRVEETFVRLIEQPTTLYMGSAFAQFLKTLKKSKLLYRAVLGSITDPAVYQPGGLRDTLAKRSLTPSSGEKFTKLYQLLHDAPIMNFTILYYVEDRANFYARTERTEVLFGYGVHERYEIAGTTYVYRSEDPRIVHEFQEIFNALRSPDFSRKLDLRRSDHFLQRAHQCDVLATFPEWPKAELLERVQSCGAKPLTPHGTRLNSRGREVRTAVSHISICVSAMRILDDQTFKRELKAALARNVKVTLAMWAPGAFLSSRIQAIGIDEDEAQREIEGMRSLAKSLGSHKNLVVKECTGVLGSVSIFWIDDALYFSPYWIGKDVSNGPHFMVMADSKTGLELRDQYERMLTTSKDMETSQPNRAT